jgi:hypothetical protein
MFVIIITCKWSRGVAGLTRVPVKDETAGSNPVATAESLDT